jgi:glyoxylase-like metal-dependent hydrolase (beta-lactamase superfamily II)
MITKLLAAAMAIFGLLPALASAQQPFDYEKTKAQYSVRDYAFSQLPERGYGYYKIAENAWFVHDDFENMVFFVTDVGVVVVDPKPDVSPFVLEVIRQVTDKPITHVIYSHHHRDHSQGAYLFPKEAVLIASKATADRLVLANDPKRPQPAVVFDREYVLQTGGLRLEMKDLGRNWHSQDDIVIWAPQQKILFAIDMFHPDAAPWIHWGESSDPWFAFGLPEMLLKQYDFNFVIVGHERIVGTPEHMKTYRAFIDDMKKTLMGIAQSEAFQVAAKEAAGRYSPAAMHYVYKESILAASNACAVQMTEKWQGKLRNAPLNMVENCQTMFIHLVILDP